MRHNLPVTQQEHIMGDDEIIVSTTDLKGRMTSVNAAFLHMSGFTEDELIGKAHNIVRHPDMPESAFQNLWDTIQAGDPWTGVVKNRCKNGDFYWVLANVAPIVEHGQTTGYLSVRTKPSAEQIKGAGDLYAAINAGKTTLGKTSILHKLNIFNRLKVWQEIVGVVLMTIVMFGAAWYEASSALKDSHDGLQMSNNDRNVALIAAKSDGILQFEQTLLLKALLQDHLVTQDDIEIIENDIESLQENLDFIKQADLGPDEREAADFFADEIHTYINELLHPAINFLKQGDMLGLRALLQEKIIDMDYSPSTQALLGMQVQLQSVSEEEFEAASSRVGRVENISNILIVAAIILAFLLVWYVTTTLSKRLAYAIKMLNRVSEGEYFDWVHIDQNDEVGAMLMALKSMQIRQGYRMTEVELMANDALRIKEALDNASSHVMLADSDYNIFYLNESMQAMMSKNESILAEVLPDFEAQNLLGKNIDIFHKNPAHQRKILDNLTDTYISDDLNVNGLWLRISMTAVLNEAGERIATATEWEDRTLQIQAESEVQAFVDAAARGDFSVQVSEQGKQGFLLKLAESLNGLSTVVEQAFADTNLALQALEKGDLTHRISNEYEGTYDAMKQAANNTAEKLADTLSDMRNSAMNVADGSAEISQGNATLSDRTQEQAAALEETSASIEEITGTVQQNADNARQANQLAINTSEQAEKGGVVAAQAVEAMAGISTSSKKISDIIGVIDEIAFQTNLLALNAAVEAARAGEQGRGFAVVAGEVRTLAGRSAEAAKEIKELINASVESVAHGSKLVDDSGAALTEIVGSVQKVTDIIAEIAAASQEQSVGIDQVNKAITQLDAAVQQNAALVEETAASSANMDQEAGDMLSLVDGFTLSEQPSRRTRPVTKKPVIKTAKVHKPVQQARPQASSSGDAWDEF